MKDSTIEVDITESSGSRFKKKANGHKSNRRSEIRLNHRPHVLNLNPVSKGDFHSQKSEGLPGSSRTIESEQWGSGGGNFQEVEHFPEYDRLRTEIRGLLFYPPVLRRRGILGTVNVRMAFTSESRCDWRRIQVLAHERHLAVYVIALLKKLCHLTVIESLKADEHKVIDVSFSFDVVNEATPPDLQKDDDWIVGNVIAFRRTTPKSLLEYQVGPIHGLWFVPAIAFDIPWIIEKWDYYVNGVDPMDAFR